MVFKKSAQKEKLIFFSFLSLLILALSLTLNLLFSHIANAQVPNPYVPCDETRPNEFHSLRPYQASPCGEPPGTPPTEEVALFCGNDLVVRDSITVSKSAAENCEDIAGGSERCYFRTANTTSIAIDLKDAEFPIAGYTEGEIDTAEKVNEYASWYLGGVINKNETEPLDPEDPNDQRLIIDFSGPLQKLLSWTSLNEIRSGTVQRAGADRHDQIVGEDTRLSAWKNKLPPSEADYRNFSDFWLDYNRWRGDICISLFGADLCFDNPLTSRYLGNLFSYIPLSSTEDRKGLVETNPVVPQVTGPGVTITDLVFSNQEPAELFVPHMREITELGTLLQQTFSPQGQPTTGGSTQVTTGPACDLAQIRYNPGDDLFAGEIAGDLSYTAEFSCDFEIPEETGSGIPCQNSANCPAGERCSTQIGRCVSDFAFDNPSCTKSIFVNLSVITKTPLAEEVWQKFVIGPASIVKRIFPKLGVDSPVASFLDIPSVTKVNYSGDGLVSAGNTSSERAGESAELYFPHIGSVHEYFLKGIQTALRPKGFGEPILSGQPDTLPDDPTADSDINCNKNAPDVNIPGLISKERFAEVARTWIAGFTNENGGICYNDVIAKARARGVSPAYALATWLLESGASNYAAGLVEDFGVHRAETRGFNDQIERFFNTVTSGLYLECAGQPFWKDRMEATLYMYRTGFCRKSGNPDGTFYYGTMIANIWPIIAPGCRFPTSPTENTCQ